MKNLKYKDGYATGGPKIATRDELCDMALKHYDEVSKEACSFNSIIPAAIEAYRREPALLEKLAGAKGALEIESEVCRLLEKKNKKSLRETQLEQFLEDHSQRPPTKEEILASLIDLSSWAPSDELKSTVVILKDFLKYCAFLEKRIQGLEERPRGFVENPRMTV